MKACLTLLLIGGLILAGSPHVFCRCGCTGVGQRIVRPVCARCAERPAPSSPAEPGPCHCRTCDLVAGVVANSPEVVPSSEPSGRVAMPAICRGIQAAARPLPLQVGRAGPPGWIAPSGCALTVFLGHLLL